MKQLCNFISKRCGYLPFFIGISFVIALLFISAVFYFQAQRQNDEQISNDITQLAAIFNKIHNCCEITGFRSGKKSIDFLNVVNFEGSQVGSMNLAKPQKWHGPYLESNFTIEGQEYQIVDTKKGFYIIPGDGVKLANGNIIGKSLIISPKSNIEKLMIDAKWLLGSNKKPLAAKINTVSKELL